MLRNKIHILFSGAKVNSSNIFLERLIPGGILRSNNSTEWVTVERGTFVLVVSLNGGLHLNRTMLKQRKGLVRYSLLLLKPWSVEELQRHELNGQPSPCGKRNSCFLFNNLMLRVLVSFISRPLWYLIRKGRDALNGFRNNFSNRWASNKNYETK